MPIYDFKCKNDHITERIELIGAIFIICPVCGEVAANVPVPFPPPLVLGETTPKVRYQVALRD
jgi:hypothetical protein